MRGYRMNKIFQDLQYKCAVKPQNLSILKNLVHPVKYVKHVQYDRMV